jgi:hypothetical protein
LIDLCHRQDSRIFAKKPNTFLIELWELWSTSVQQANEIVIASLPTQEDGLVGSYPDHGVRHVAKSETSKHKVAVPLFPQLAFDSTTIYGGMVLWSDQPAIIIARDQILDISTNRPNRGSSFGLAGNRQFDKGKRDHD